MGNGGDDPAKRSGIAQKPPGGAEFVVRRPGFHAKQRELRQKHSVVSAELDREEIEVLLCNAQQGRTRSIAAFRFWFERQAEEKKKIQERVDALELENNALRSRDLAQKRQVQQAAGNFRKLQVMADCLRAELTQTKLDYQNLQDEFEKWKHKIAEVLPPTNSCRKTESEKKKAPETDKRKNFLLRLNRRLKRELSMAREENGDLRVAQTQLLREKSALQDRVQITESDRAALRHRIASEFKLRWEQLHQQKSSPLAGDDAIVSCCFGDARNAKEIEGLRNELRESRSVVEELEVELACVENAYDELLENRRLQIDFAMKWRTSGQKMIEN